MIRLECIEDGCPFQTQELPFENAEKVLQMHLDRKHPSGAPPFQMMAPSASLTQGITSMRDTIGELNKKIDHMTSELFLA